LDTDKPVPGDYDGDGRTDVAVHRKLIAFPETGTWWVMYSQDHNYCVTRWTSNNIGEFDIPVPADYDGDGETDLAYYRLSDQVGRTGTFFILKSTTNTGFSFDLGVPSLGDRPVPADYDGDGKADLAVYRNGTWLIRQSTNEALRVESFGLDSDKVVPGDFDGDGKWDIAVWRPSEGMWYLHLSKSDAITYTRFGLADDKPVPDDYDGDGKTDIAVFRPANGIWYILRSSDNVPEYHYFGLSSDIPLQNVFVR
jgi:hypothetical protein